LEQPVPIVRCDTCAEIADAALEGGPERFQQNATVFLSHVVESHPGELLGLLAERYGPIFLARREMR
jgi:hypothetical protein